MWFGRRDGLSGLSIPESLKALVEEAIASDQSWFRFDINQLASAKPLKDSTGEERKSLVMDLCRLIVSLIVNVTVVAERF